MKALFFGGASDMADPLVKRWPESVRCTQDVRDYVDVAYAVQDFIARHGHLDVVVNFAGVSCVQYVYGSSVNNWAHEINVNLLGSYHVARAVVEHSPRTKMIFIASVAGLYGKPHHSGYCASKAGVISLMQSLAMEGFDAYAISPGRVNTKMREHDYPGEDVRSRLTIEEVADLIEAVANGQYHSGDNIIIRRLGFTTQPIHVEPTAQQRKEVLGVFPDISVETHRHLTKGTPPAR